MMKKLIATALAAAMIFGLVSVALAAGFSDIEDHARKNDILKLVSLGIIDGYPDGTFKPENPVTRAEFAKLIVTTMGLGDAAKLMAGVATPFADVPANHWASGYINLAHSEDIIDGYPDGTFKPAGNVTYAEALKMVLCALGYTEDLIKPIYWPVTWIAKSVNVGLTKGVDVSPNLPAPRGEIAALLENSLVIKKVVQVGFGDKSEFQITDETFLSALANEVSGYLVGSPELFGVTKLEVKGHADKLKVLNEDDVKGLLGHKVKVWFNANNEVLFVEDLTPAASVKTATFVNGTKVKIGKDEVSVDGTLMFRNFAGPVAVSSENQLKKGDEVKVIYEGDTKKYVVAVGYSLGVVDNISTLYKSVIFKDALSLSLKDVDAKFYGDAESLADLKEYDVVQYVKSGKYAAVVVTRDAFSGKFAKLSSGGVATVGDVEVEETTINIDSLFEYGIKESLLGKTVKVLLDKDGAVAYMEEVSSAAAKYVGYVLSRNEVPTKEGTEYYVKLLLSDGSKVIFEASKESVYTAATVDVAVTYKLNSDELLSEVVPVSYTGSGTLTIKNKASGIVDYPGGTTLVTPSTIIFDLSDSDKPAVLSSSDFLGLKTLAGDIKVEGGKATVIVLSAGAGGVGTTWGVSSGWYKTGAATVVQRILTDGSVVDYVYKDEGSAGYKAGIVFTFEVDGEDEATFVVEDAHRESVEESYDVRISSIDGNLITTKKYDVATGAATEPAYYLVDKDTQYVDATGSVPKVLDSLFVGAKVDVYSESKDGVEWIRVIVVR